jgi:hypothetical protein
MIFPNRNSLSAKVYLFPFPFSLLLPGCQAVESFATSLAHQAKMKTPG